MRIAGLKTPESGAEMLKPRAYTPFKIEEFCAGGRLFAYIAKMGVQP